MSGDVVRSEIVDGALEVTTRHRLYASVPASERVTAEMLHGGAVPSHALERELRHLTEARCIVAVRSQRFDGFWHQCTRLVLDGHDRCVSHGGPRKEKVASELTRLRTEVADLRSRLAALEHPADRPTKEQG